MTTFVKITKEDELTHFGVQGMRWGHRTRSSDLPRSSTRKAYDNAKIKKKEANKDYTKEFNKVTANPLNSFTKKGDKLYDGVMDKMNTSIKADAKFKKVKTDRKDKIKEKYQTLNGETKLAEKLIYNNATRKKAAKYVVDNDMSVEEASKRAKGDAIRNTTLMVAAYGAYKVTDMYLKNRQSASDIANLAKMFS